MVTPATLGRLLAGVALLLGNGYFVTIEFAMTRIRQFDESDFRGVGGLERAWEMTERLEISLSGCQLGITVCSVVHVPALLDRVDDLRSGELTFADVAAPPMTVGPDTPVSDLIDQFQAQQQELAVVVSESEGRTVGLVTATDAFEAIAGELEDPLDADAAA
jgi:CBS domain containing-hemolysin-like protein